jgi:hypothetical protein
MIYTQREAEGGNKKEKGGDERGKKETCGVPASWPGRYEIEDGLAGERCACRPGSNISLGHNTDKPTVERRGSVTWTAARWGLKEAIRGRV